MAGLGELVISLHADTARFASDMGRASHISEREWRKVSRSAADVGKQIGVAMSVAGLAMIAMGKQAIDAADELGKMAQKVGVSTESLSALNYAAGLSDVSLESLGNGLKKLSVNMLDMQGGTGEARFAFKALGLDVEATKGVLKSSEQVLFEVADKFAAMEDGAGKTALAVKLFGRAGADLIPLLNGGADGLRKNAEEAKRFGLILSTDATKAAEDFNDNLTRIKEGVRGMSLAIANDALPWLNKMVEQLLEGTKIAGGFAEALRLFGLSTITSGNAGSKIREITDEIARLEKQRSEFEEKGRTGFLPNIDGAIADLKKKLEFAKFLEKQTALALGAAAGGDTPGERARGARALNKAPALPDEGAINKAAAAAKRAAEQAAKELERIQKESLDSQRRLHDADLRAMEDYRKQIAKISAEVKERQYYENIFGADAEGATTEELKARLKNMLDGVDALEQAWIRAGLAAADFDENGKAIIDKLKETDDFAKSLGLTFTSAFEDAALGGKKFRDVLQGIGQDIARILIRKTVTEPIANAIGSIDFSSIFSGSFATGTDYVPRTGLALVHEGEAIIPAGENRMSGSITQNIRVDSRSDMVSIQHAMAVSRQQAVAALRDRERRTVRSQ